ncbi:hypothetical protein D9M68_984710 [compost metagenome]
MPPRADSWLPSSALSRPAALDQALRKPEAKPAGVRPTSGRSETMMVRAPACCRAATPAARSAAAAAALA